VASILAPSDIVASIAPQGNLDEASEGREQNSPPRVREQVSEVRGSPQREVFRPPFVQVHHYLPVAAPCCDSCAITASRLNAAGFCRGGNLMKLAISPATTACIKYIWGT